MNFNNYGLKKINKKKQSKTKTRKITTNALKIIYDFDFLNFLMKNKKNLY